jgi:protoporphyrinogen oxidase
MTRAAPPRVAVVGGGMLGLTLALRLAERGYDVTLKEAGQSLGGLAAPWELDGVEWDRHYHVILQSDSHLLRLLSELKLEDQVVWRSTRTKFYANGRMHGLNDVFDYLRLPLISLFAKTRLALQIWAAGRRRNGRKLEDVPLSDWLQRWSGTEAYEKIWLPLLRAKLGSNHRRASAAFIWAVMRRLYGARSRGTKKEVFGYVRGGGYKRILSALEQRARQQGVQICLNSHVEAIHAAEGGGLLLRQDGRSEHFEKVVVTAACSIVARLCQSLTPAELSNLRDVPYQGIVCASVLLETQLSDAYLTYIADETVPFTAVVNMTALVDPEELKGRSLVYLPLYLPAEDSRFALSDEEIRSTFLGALRRLYPDLQRNTVHAFRISRVREVMAVPVVGLGSRLPRTTTSVPGLFVINSAQIRNGTLNVNEVLGLAEDRLPQLTHDVEASASGSQEKAA